jgi:spore coat polysaccharide biosynthesis predicted glycosyltransferase SpsG
MSGVALVEICCDGNQQIGYGHIRRSSALAVQLEKEGLAVKLTGLSEEAKKLLPVAKEYKQQPSIVVFDSLEGIDQQIQKAQSEGKTTVTLDWFGDTIPEVNIVVYPHNEVRAKNEKYIGFEYIMLRDEILKVERSQSSNNQNVLVCLGGGNLLGQAYEAGIGLKNKGLTVTVVQGPLAKNILWEEGIQILINPPDFPSLLANCDWAVTNGAGCFFEAMYLGKSAFVLPQTEMEIRIAGYAKERGALLGMGMENLRVFSVDELQKVSEQGKKLVDGRGTERIASIITNLI